VTAMRGPAQPGLRNVLHDQGIPNTLRGVGPAATAIATTSQWGRSAAVLAVVVAAAALAIAVVLLT
jgi:hypothetical protein